MEIIKSNDIGSPNKSIKQILTEYKFVWFAFLLPAMLTFLVYAVWQVWPFGKTAVLVLDLNGQYVYFFEELRSMVYEGRSLLYSFGRTLGGEFMGIYAYYLASPLSYIVCLFPKKNICEAIYFILVLKAGLCGASMAFYLYKTKKAVMSRILAFSTMYALCSYAVVQAHNTMWIDELYWLPLLVLGIESLIKKGKYKLYVVSLSMCLLTNYYIGYMMCIFTVLYFIYYYFSRKDNNYMDEKYHFIKTVSRAILFTVIGIGIAAVIILCAYYSLQFGKNTFSETKFTFEFKNNFIDLFRKFFADSYDSVEPDGLPFLYCGTITLLLAPIYFMSSKIKAREKIWSGILIFVLIMSFMIPAVDIVWHGFQKPNWLNFRYSFILCFFLVSIAYKAFGNLHDISMKAVFGIASAYSIILLIIQLQDYDNFGSIAIVINLVLVFAAVAMLYYVKHGLTRTCSTVLLIFTCIELFGNALLNIYYLDDQVVYGKRNAYVNYMEKYSDSVDYIKSYDGTEFFRMEKSSYKKSNDPMALGFYGISNSTSTLNKPVINLLNKMGYASKSHWTRYFGGTPVSDALLGIKYVIYQEEQPNYPYDLIYTDEQNGLYTYMNPYALSLAYCTSEKIADYNMDSDVSAFVVLNKMISKMLGSKTTIEVFKPIDYTTTTSNCSMGMASGHSKYSPASSSSNASITYHFTAPNDSVIYYFFPTNYPRECKVTLNGEEFDKLFTKDKTSINNIGSFKEGEEISLNLKLEDDNLYIKNGAPTYFYYLDMEILTEVMAELQNNQLNITQFESTNIIGNVNVTEEKSLLFTTIPYDEGWHVTVDGVKAEITKTCDSLLAVPLGEGEHEIEFVYMPDCFVYGIIITIISLLIFIGICIADYLIKKKNPQRAIILRDPDEYPFDWDNIPGKDDADVGELEKLFDEHSTDETNEEIEKEEEREIEIEKEKEQNE